MTDARTGEPAPLTLDRLADEVDTVIVTAPDLQGRLFGRRVSATSFVESVSRTGLLVSSCVYAWDIAQDPSLLASGALPYCGFHTGMADVTLVPDLATLVRAGWLERTAICLADSLEADGRPTPVAPRTLLVEELRRWDDAGLRASVGTELEFYLFRGTPRDARRNDYRDLEPTIGSRADYSIYEGDEFDPFFAGVRTALHTSGIEIEASQIEWGLGQWETTLRHCPPLEMADRHVLYKLATKTLAARAGMTASFMAKPYDHSVGSSCHVHLSVRDAAGAPIFWSDDARHHLAPALQHAVGGALAHAGDFMAWYAPTVNSYRRTRGQDAAGWGLTWGFEHRFASVRVVGERPDDLRLELRLPGADANPYLVLTALLASVREGLATSTDPGPELSGNPYESPAEGIPADLGSAVEAFSASGLARRSFGDEVVDHYATVGRFEWSTFLDSVTDWERRRYLELI